MQHPISCNTDAEFLRPASQNTPEALDALSPLRIDMSELCFSPTASEGTLFSDEECSTPGPIRHRRPSIKSQTPKREYLGVLPLPDGTYQAYVAHAGFNSVIGVFKTKVAAAKAHDKFVCNLAAVSSSPVVLNFPGRQRVASVSSVTSASSAPSSPSCDEDGFPREGKSGANPCAWRGVNETPSGRFQARLNRCYLGLFDNAEDAAHVWDVAALNARGTQTELNFPMDHYAYEDGVWICRVAVTSRPQSRALKFRGVKKTPSGRYQARIKMQQQSVYLGLFETEENAARAFDLAALKHHGKLNFPESHYYLDSNGQYNVRPEVMGKSADKNDAHDMKKLEAVSRKPAAAAASNNESPARSVDTVVRRRNASSAEETEAGNNNNGATVVGLLEVPPPPPVVASFQMCAPDPCSFLDSVTVPDLAGLDLASAAASLPAEDDDDLLDAASSMAIVNPFDTDFWLPSGSLDAGAVNPTLPLFVH